MIDGSTMISVQRTIHDMYINYKRWQDDGLSTREEAVNVINLLIEVMANFNHLKYGKEKI